ncbi:hypothetical protein GCM10022224_093270 [Nonomuraea antimicrobica]|uniref:Uncharacterized protein n=1 Tax=Nonomuraea antimicrobica TaxID=561173 RepID=A0ABP7E786_9ACTN
MSNTPAPEPQQERKAPKKITVRRLDKIETTGVLKPSHGNSN